MTTDAIRNYCKNGWARIVLAQHERFDRTTIFIVLARHSGVAERGNMQVANLEGIILQYFER